MTDIKNLTSVAATVASEYASNQDAARARDAAEGELLARVVESVRTALPAISPRIKTAWRQWWIDNSKTDDESTYHPMSGVCLDNDKAGPALKFRGNGHSDYLGDDLFLLSDGTWLRLTYSGRDSAWQGQGSSWTSDSETLTSAQVAEEYDIDALLNRLATKLQSAVGKREEHTARYKERAEKIRALLALL